jgi:Uma2 family endonuclease
MSVSPLANPNQTPIDGVPIRRRNPTIADFNFREGLPSADDLPCSDGKPVDSELQELIPGLLKAILLDLWRERTDWLFGIDMGLYYDPEQPAISPDGFLSLGVKEPPNENLRPSYVLWHEQVIPLLAFEIVSKSYGKEHSKKLEIYQSIGVLYYVIYAPLRKRKPPFQIYKLIEGVYVLQYETKAPYWMPEIGLGIGIENRSYGGRLRDWLYWYDEQGQRLLTPTERAEAESNRAKLESSRATSAEQQNKILMARLRELGVDPATLLGEMDEPIEE